MDFEDKIIATGQFGMVVVVVLPDPFRGIGAMEEFRGDRSTVGLHPKVWTSGQRSKSVRHRTRSALSYVYVTN